MTSIGGALLGGCQCCACGGLRDRAARLSLRWSLGSLGLRLADGVMTALELSSCVATAGRGRSLFRAGLDGLLGSDCAGRRALCLQLRHACVCAAQGWVVASADGCVWREDVAVLCSRKGGFTYAYVPYAAATSAGQYVALIMLHLKTSTERA